MEGFAGYGRYERTDNNKIVDRIDIVAAQLVELKAGLQLQSMQIVNLYQKINDLLERK